MFHYYYFTAILAAYFAGVAMAQDAEFCRTRSTPYTCLAQLFSREIMDQVAKLQDLNLLGLTKMSDDEITVKLDAMDRFCKPFLATMKCRNASTWWECDRDVKTVKGMIETLQAEVNVEDATIRPQWQVAQEKIVMYMRYAHLICNGTSGMRQILNNKQCIIEGSANASEHFRDIQLPRLSAILTSPSFKGKCCNAQQGVLDLMTIVDESCPNKTADDIYRFISASFNIVPGFSSETCPMTRSGAPLPCDENANLVPENPEVEEEQEPSHCAKRTSPHKYRCFTRNLRSDVMSKIAIFKDVTPISLINLSEDELARRVTVVHEACEFLNATVGCAGEWWQCKSDVIAVTDIINDLVISLNSAAITNQSLRLATSFVRRHFKLAGYLCQNDDLDRLFNNRSCAETGLKTVQPAVDRLGDILSGKVKFNAAEQCNATRSDVKTVAQAIQTSCQSTLKDFTTSLLSAAFLLIDSYSQASCNFLENAQL